MYYEIRINSDFDKKLRKSNVLLIRQLRMMKEKGILTPRLIFDYNSRIAILCNYIHYQKEK